MSSELHRQLSLTCLLVLVGGCHAPPRSAPCGDFDCSGHGTCTVVVSGSEQVPTCLCDVGYVPSASGWLCLPPSDTSLCAGVGCSGHGRCVSFRGSPRCLCDEGYRLGPQESSCQDPCEGVDCGLGSCERVAGEASCVCQAGAWLTPDAARCDRIAGPFLTYQLTLDDSPDWSFGTATIDLTEMRQGVLSEMQSFDVFGYSLSRRARQRWTIDEDALQVRELVVDDELRQGKVTRRRYTEADFVTREAMLTRLSQTFQRPLQFVGELTPVPMLGGFEFPGWSPGASSIAGYLLAFSRYDWARGGQQTLELFYPTPAITRRVAMYGSATDDSGQQRVLEIPQLNVRVIYRLDLPDTIQVINLGISWRRHDGMPHDINMAELPPATKLTPAVLPPAIETTAVVSSADGTALGATLSRPASSPPTSGLPAVLLINGFEAADRDHPHNELPQSPQYRHLAAILAEAGYVALRYDPRPIAADTTLADGVADAATAFQTLAGAEGVDGSRVFVAASGRANIIAQSLLPQVPARGYLALAPVVADLSAVVIYAETAHLTAAGVRKRFVERQQEGYAATLKALLEGTFGEPSWRDLPATLWQQLLSFDGRAALAGFSGPVLALRGDEDLIIPPQQLDLLAEAAASSGKQNLTSKQLEGLGHTLAEGAADDIWERAHFPLQLDSTATSEVIAWLEANQ